MSNQSNVKMAEGTYEYECMRAELLGVEKPNYDDFIKKKQERIDAAEEEQEIENLKETEAEESQTKHIAGGLDELNSILQVTQRKINRFKASCSSFTSLLKFKLGNSSASEPVNGSVKTETNSETNDSQQQSAVSSANGDCSDNPRKSDLTKALDNHVDRLDSLIDKAENAQYSMAHQNKEMKKFLM